MRLSPLSTPKVGCAIWGLKSWRGELFAAKTPAKQFLRHYSSVFSAVEGNTTFYGLPKQETVLRWRDTVSPTFQFCFKFPKRISHELALRGAVAETAAFFNTLEPLQSRLGPFFLQLPPTCGPENLSAIEHYLASLPSEHAYALECRHPGFFDRGGNEARLVDILNTLEVDRVIMDARVLHRTASQEASVVLAQSKKPNLPARRQASGLNPFLRLVGNNDTDSALPCLKAWGAVIAAWLREGRRPYIFLHSPDDFYAPRLARALYTCLQEYLDIPSMPTWPVDRQQPAAQSALPIEC